MNKLKQLLSYLRASFWFLPSLIVAFSIALAVGLIEADTTGRQDWMADWPRLFGDAAKRKLPKQGRGRPDKVTIRQMPSGAADALVKAHEADELLALDIAQDELAIHDPGDAVLISCLTHQVGGSFETLAAHSGAMLYK